MKTDLRRSKQPTPELQHAINERKKVVNKILSEIKQGKRQKQIIVKR